MNNYLRKKKSVPLLDSQEMRHSKKITGKFCKKIYEKSGQERYFIDYLNEADQIKIKQRIANDFLL